MFRVDPNAKESTFTNDDIQAMAHLANLAEHTIATIRENGTSTATELATTMTAMNNALASGMPEHITLIDYMAFGALIVADAYDKLQQGAEDIKKAQADMEEVFSGFEPGIEVDEYEGTESNDRWHPDEL